MNEVIIMTINKKCFNKSLTRDWSNVKAPLTIIFAIIAATYLGIVFYEAISKFITHLPISASAGTIIVGLVVVLSFLIDLDKEHVKSNPCIGDIGVLTFIFIIVEVLTVVFFGMYNSSAGYTVDIIAYFTEVIVEGIAAFILICISTPLFRAYHLCNNEPDEEEPVKKEETKMGVSNGNS